MNIDKQFLNVVIGLCVLFTTLACKARLTQLPSDPEPTVQDLVMALEQKTGAWVSDEKLSEQELSELTSFLQSPSLPDKNASTYLGGGWGVKLRTQEVNQGREVELYIQTVEALLPWLDSQHKDKAFLAIYSITGVPLERGNLRPWSDQKQRLLASVLPGK